GGVRVSPHRRGDREGRSRDERGSRGVRASTHPAAAAWLGRHLRGRGSRVRGGDRPPGDPHLRLPRGGGDGPGRVADRSARAPRREGGDAVKREYWKYMKTIIPYLRRHKLLASASMFLMVAGALAALAQPWPLAFVVDDVLGRRH